MVVAVASGVDGVVVDAARAAGMGGGLGMSPLSDVVVRGQEALSAYELCRIYGVTPAYPARLVADLVAELKAARQDLAELQARSEHA